MIKKALFFSLVEVGVQKRRCLILWNSKILLVLGPEGCSYACPFHKHLPNHVKNSIWPVQKTVGDTWANAEGALNSRITEAYQWHLATLHPMWKTCFNCFGSLTRTGGCFESSVAMGGAEDTWPSVGGCQPTRWNLLAVWKWNRQRHFPCRSATKIPLQGVFHLFGWSFPWLSRVWLLWIFGPKSRLGPWYSSPSSPSHELKPARTYCIYTLETIPCFWGGQPRQGLLRR